MRYLRRFNESLGNELKDLCDDYLAYLKDDNFKVNIIHKPSGVEELCIFKSGQGVNLFTWDDVKYDIIPFLDILSKNYWILDTLPSYITASFENLTGMIFAYKSKDYEDFIHSFIKIDDILDKDFKKVYIYTITITFRKVYKGSQIYK